MKIFAFEPDPFTFKYLIKNVKKNSIKNCLLFNIGASDKKQNLNFYRILDPIQNLDSGLTLNLNLPYETIKIKTEKLSTLINKIRKIDLLKMDIEGEEYRVFDDIIGTNSINKIDKIFFESHSFKKRDLRNYQKLLINLNKIGKVQSRKNSEFTQINYWQNLDKQIGLS